MLHDVACVNEFNWKLKAREDKGARWHAIAVVEEFSGENVPHDVTTWGDSWFIDD